MSATDEELELAALFGPPKTEAEAERRTRAARERARVAAAAAPGIAADVEAQHKALFGNSFFDETGGPAE